MATNKKKIFKFKGNSLDTKEDKLMKYIDANTYFSGSVEFDKSSTIIFKCVNARTMKYIIDDLIKDSEELKIEIRNSKISNIINQKWIRSRNGKVSKLNYSEIRNSKLSKFCSAGRVSDCFATSASR